MKRKALSASIASVLVLLFLSNDLAGQAQDKGTGVKPDYGKNIVYTPAPPPETPPEATNLGQQPADMLKQITYLDSQVVPGAYYAECSWLYKAYPDIVWVTEHTHDADEVFGLYGSDPANPNELNGEIELWIGGERHVITKSCLIFVPKGVKHCPLKILRVDKPIFFFTTMPAHKYAF